jgi:glyoxylase-like metal-dependent hydrolase (beta-lactamase superfamily II)
MNVLASGLSYVDLNFLGVPRIIATVVLHGPGGVALIDPGPSSTLPALRAALEQAGIAMADLRAILLTHIHLDHAGATGTLVHQNPGLRVYVHEKGAPHLVAPERLIASATRLWGDEMDRLWGEFRPVPEHALTILRGGERFTAGARDLDVAYTPGHASHHVSYYNADSGVAFVGDTAGIRRAERGFVLPPTPPPDIDVELWLQSIQTIERWQASTLFLTHFGPVTSAISAHLQSLADNLQRSATLVRESLATEGTDDDRKSHYEARMMAELRAQMSEELARAYETAAGFRMSWPGLARYWRKKAG